MYNINDPHDYERWLKEVWFVKNPELAVDENSNYLGRNFTPEESVERLKVTFSKSWPNGTDQPPVVDTISTFVHLFVNYHSGYDPHGAVIPDAKRIGDGKEGATLAVSGWAIVPEQVKVLVVDTELTAKVDELIKKVDEFTNK